MQFTRSQRSTRQGAGAYGVMNTRGLTVWLAPLQLRGGGAIYACAAAPHAMNTRVAYPGAGAPGRRAAGGGGAIYARPLAPAGARGASTRVMNTRGLHLACLLHPGVRGAIYACLREGLPTDRDLQQRG